MSAKDIIEKNSEHDLVVVVMMLTGVSVNPDTVRSLIRKYKEGVDGEDYETARNEVVLPSLDRGAKNP